MWTAKVMQRPNTYHLGTFNSEEAAAKAYDMAALKLKGLLAASHTNFDAAGELISVHVSLPTHHYCASLP